MEKYKISEYAKLHKLSYRSIWNRVKEGKLIYEKTETGRILIFEQKVKILNVVIYARVSSTENKDNLEKQKERLVNYCLAKGYIVNKVITEIGSGLNDNRKKLESILLDRNINLIVVEHSDRLARFGLNYIKKLLELDGRNIEIVNPTNTVKEDLIQDFVSIITSFTARLYGQRRNKRRTEKLIKELNNN